MKIEYLLIKKKNDICSDIDSFKSLLSSNTRLSFKDDKTLCIGKDSYSYALSVSEPESIGEVVFNLSVKTTEKDDNGAKALEEFDKLLHRLVLLFLFQLFFMLLLYHSYMLKSIANAHTVQRSGL